MEAQNETTSADFLGYRFMLSKTNEMMRLVKPKSKQKLRIWKIGFKRKSVDDVAASTQQLMKIAA